MLKIFVVDDDKIIRRGLKAIIENYSEEIAVIGEASNGKSALGLILQLKPDILITDIKMPVMDGIELIRKVQELGIKLKMIVLSGFDEYKYVREALKLGASDYILKPVENNVLLQLLEHLGEQIEIEKKEEERFMLISEKMTESIELLKERFVLDIIDGKWSGEEKELNQFEVSGTETFHVALISIDKDMRFLESLKKSGQGFTVEMLREIMTGCINAAEDLLKVFLASREERIIMLFASGQANEAQAETAIVRYLEEIRKKLETEMDYKVTAAVTGAFYGIDQCHRFYASAEITLQRRFFEGGSRIIKEWENKPLYADKKAVVINEEIGALLAEIEIDETEKVKRMSEKFIEKLRSSNVSPEDFGEEVLSLFVKIFYISDDYKELEREFNSGEAGVLYCIKHLSNINYLQEYMTVTIEKIMNRIRSIRKEKGKRVIEICKAYIELHYHEDISLKEVADHVFLNYTYLSELFKMDTGKNFSDFLAETRIKAAKKLLAQTQLKVYEIGPKVGYNEVVSFNRIFKKTVGISPAYYRKIIR